MIRFLLRCLGAVVLAVALVYAVADIARSLADDAVMLTPMAQALDGLGLPATPPDGPSAEATHLMSRMLTWPVSVILAALGFLLLAVGRPAHPRARRLPF